MVTSAQRLLDLELQTLLEMASVADTHGVKIAIENLPPVLSVVNGQETTYGLDPERITAQLAAAAHDNVCGTLDLSHAYAAANYRGVDLIEFIKPFLPYVNHLHFHDSFGQPWSLSSATDAEMLAYGIGDLHLPLGWGDIDWERIVPQLAIRKGTILTIEIAPSLATEKDIAKSVKRARELASLFEEHGRATTKVEAA